MHKDKLKAIKITVKNKCLPLNAIRLNNTFTFSNSYQFIFMHTENILLLIYIKERKQFSKIFFYMYMIQACHIYVYKIICTIQELCIMLISGDLFSQQTV